VAQASVLVVGAALASAMVSVVARPRPPAALGPSAGWGRRVRRQCALAAPSHYWVLLAVADLATALLVAALGIAARDAAAGVDLADCAPGEARCALVLPQVLPALPLACLACLPATCALLRLAGRTRVRLQSRNPCELLWRARHR
jgi:hypothetical protein